MLKKICFVGASVGKAWEIEKIKERVSGLDNYEFEYICDYNFDKSTKLNDVVNRKEKPYAVMLKECAAYFPGDFSSYTKLIVKWKSQFDQAGILFYLVTTAPVTKMFHYKYLVKSILKCLLTFKIDVAGLFINNAILNFNDWIKSYCEKEESYYFDLEKIIATKSRFLNGRFTSGDGLHLNSKAYSLLDIEIEKFLKTCLSDRHKDK